MGCKSFDIGFISHVRSQDRAEAKIVLDWGAQAGVQRAKSAAEGERAIARDLVRQDAERRHDYLTEDLLSLCERHGLATVQQRLHTLSMLFAR